MSFSTVYTPITPDDDLRKSRSLSSVDFQRLTIFHINIRELLSHAAELEAQIQLMEERPSIITLNERFLDNSVEDFTISGYILVSRRDR